MPKEEVISFPVSVGSTPRDASPESSICYPSNISSSLFSSSASPSNAADRSFSSFASDFHDQNVISCENASAIPDPRKLRMMLNDNLILSTEGVLRMDTQVAAEGDIESARTSFTLAVKECQKRREDSLQRISDCHRPVSVELNNNVSACSPSLELTKNSSILKHCSGALTSPVTPNYRHTNGGLQKGWSSERVPFPQNGNRRQLGGAYFTFNNGGGLPSKWEDAERWIFGPVNSDTGVKPSVPQTQTRARSKSGPLGPSGVSYYSYHSPAMHMFDGIHGGDRLAGSPYYAGSDSLHKGKGFNLGCPANSESKITRSVSTNGCTTDLPNQFSVPHSPRIDEEHGDVNSAASDISRAILKRDMATQMSPEGSTCSSSRRKHSVSSALSTAELRSNNSPKLDVRDVEVDERVTFTRWSRKNKSQQKCRGTEKVDEWTSKIATTHSTAWDLSETANSISKVRKEEARIASWENLQKAKAEAAVKKLEMKLEKKRSSSMDKIMNKLRLAQKKGQEMRRAVLANQAQQVSNSSNGTISLQPTRRLSSLGGCFTCHAHAF